jgi:putative acetyltransferase
VPSLFRIWRDAVEATHHFLSVEDRNFFSHLVREQYLPATQFTVAVDEADRPVAFLGMTGAKIDALFVAPDQHGRGIGRRMIEHVRQGQPKLSVDVNEQNEGAVAFYKRLGFRRAGRSQFDDSGRPYPILHLETAG